MKNNLLDAEKETMRPILGLRFWLFVSILSLMIQCSPCPAYDAQYLNETIGRKAVSLGDGCQFIMYLLNLENKYPSFEEQMQFLKNNQYAPPAILTKEENTPLSRGELAYMIAKTLHLKGGLKARLFGLNERFAMEELIHQDIMRAGHAQDLVTGQELVVLMTRSAEHLSEQMKR